MKRVFTVLLIASLIGGCSGQTASEGATVTPLPVVDLTAEAARQALGDGTAPSLNVTTVDTSTVIHFEDMQPETAEIDVQGDLVATGAFPTSDMSLVEFTSALNAGGTIFPPRQVVFNIDVRPSTADPTTAPGRLDVILFVPEGLTGAQPLVRATSITAQQYGVAVTLSGVEDNFLAVSNPTALVVQGDLRVLENDSYFTAAFDFILINSATNHTVRVVGRVNQLPYTAQ